MTFLGASIARLTSRTVRWTPDCRTDGPLDTVCTYCRTVRRTVNECGHRGIASRHCRTAVRNCRTVGPSDCRTVGKLSDTVGIHCRTVGPGLSSRAGARCHLWVPTGCTAHERHRGEALHCQLLGRNQGSRWQTSCYQRCGARDWGRGKGQQHAYPVGEVPKLTVSRRMSKKIRHEREDQLVDGHSSDTAIMPLFAQGPWQAVRREPTTIEWPVSRLSPRGVG